MPEVRSRLRIAGSAGYTLVELAIVIVVLGVLAGVAGTRFFDQQAFSERAYADELAAARRSAQQTAVASGCAARIVVAASSYAGAQQAAAGNGCNPLDATWSTPIIGPDGAALQGTAPSGTSTATTGSFVFDAQGRLSSSPATTLAVGGHVVSIDAATGYVQVQ
ncbi:MAG: prepilin-type N-terminal cleavage/methylation domain-containing protein [Steroidobacteraceae bacterium]